MQVGDRYVVGSQNTLYRLSNSSCVEGDSITLQNAVVERYFLVNGSWQASDSYVVGAYNSSTYVCHVWDQTKTYDVNYLILPATLFVICFFCMIYRWFIRLRG